jgi:hypothetical protein
MRIDSRDVVINGKPVIKLIRVGSKASPPGVWKDKVIIKGTSSDARE